MPRPASSSARFVILVLAVAAGASVGNLYLLQPLLPEVARELGTTPRAMGLVSMLTQIGYGAGMFLFVPLGDVTERRRLMLVLLAAVAVALLGVAAAPGVSLLALASLAVGMTTVVPQLAVPLAAHLAPPEERGRAVGTVMGGLLVGILLARTASGFLGGALGWRAVYVVAAGLMLALAAALRRLLPRSPPDASLPYPALLRSMFAIAREEPVLREASLLGALGFAAFSVFWGTLAFFLEARHGLGPDAAGLFGLLGAAGALAAPVLGRLADRTRPRANAGVALLVALAAWGVFAAAGSSLGAAVAGVLLLDVGVQGNHVSNLARVHARRPEARSRMNTIYMVTYFAGGALGTAVGTWAWTGHGWPGVCVAGAAFVLAARGVWALAPGRDASGRGATPRRRRGAPPPGRAGRGGRYGGRGTAGARGRGLPPDRSSRRTGITPTRRRSGELALGEASCWKIRLIPVIEAGMGGNGPASLAHHSSPRAAPSPAPPGGPRGPAFRAAPGGPKMRPRPGSSRPAQEAAPP